MQYASSGAQVVGVDIAAEVVASINAGQPRFPGEPGLAEGLAAAVDAGSLTATTSTQQAMTTADVVVVVVPLLVDDAGLPDFAPIDGATAAIGSGLQRGQLVIYETTLPIGTTRDRFGAALAAASGLTAGDEFLLAFSPERVSSGTMFADLRRYPKIVGGINDASTAAAVAFFTRVLQFDARDDLGRANGVWDVGSSETAEFVKLAETTYRDVNIALANEFAEHAEQLGLDYPVIAEAANSQPYSHLHRPGIAVGGHCIPVYPRLYLASHPKAVLPAASRAVNEAQPERMVHKLEEALGSLDGLTVAVLGAAYRGGVKETAFSGVFPLVEALEARGAMAVVHDPLYGDNEIAALGLVPTDLNASIDAAIVHTDHQEYRGLTPADLPKARAIADGRGVVNLGPWNESGATVIVIGHGDIDASHVSSGTS